MIRHRFSTSATSLRKQGYSLGDRAFAVPVGRQESVLMLQGRSGAPCFPGAPAISASPRSFLAAFLSLVCVFSLGVDVPATARIPAPPAKDKKQKQDPALKGLPVTELSPDEAILHALNRLAYGPRPGDVERIRQMGLAKWIDQQLNPGSVDDKAVEARLQNLPTLRMSTAKL